MVNLYLFREMDIGKKIKTIREIKNLTQEHLAEKLEITQSAYSKLESGSIDIPFSKLEEIATLLGLPVEEVVGFNEKMIFNIKGNRKASGLVINQVSGAEKKVYDEYIESLKTENTYLKSMIDKLLTKK